MEKNLGECIQEKEEIEKKEVVGNNIEVVIELDQHEIQMNNIITYCIKIQNKSDKELKNCRVIQKNSNNLNVLCGILDNTIVKNLDISNEAIMFHLNEIEPRQNRIIKVVVQVKESNELKHIINYATLIGKYTKDNNIDEEVVVKSNTCVLTGMSKILSLKYEPSFIDNVVGENVTLKLIIENKDHVKINNVIIRDLLNSHLKFLNGTVKIDGVAKPNENILSGINVGNFEKGCFKEVTFDVNILSSSQNGVISNKAFAQYEYHDNKIGKLRAKDIESNELRILAQLVDLKLDKIADKNQVSLGDEVTFTIVMENCGGVEIKQVVLQEFISEEFELIQGSFYLNGQVVNNVDLIKGLSIGNIQIGGDTIIEYTVKYNKVNDENATNKTVVKFNYEQKDDTIFTAKQIEKDLSIKCNINTFKGISISERVYIDRNKPNISEVDNVSAEVNILEYHLVNSINGKSNQGQILTGHKVVLQGIIDLIIEYTSSECNKSAYTLMSYVPFSTFIILPDNFKERSKVDIDYKIENISFTNRDEECVYINMCLLLIAKIQQVKD